MKEIRFVFNKINKDIFHAIQNGEKKIETRANTTKYKNINKGDVALFVCDGESFKKKIINVSHYTSIPLLLKTFTPSEINPKYKTEEELTEMYYSFPDYKEKLAKDGILALELDNI